jgi:hypothetical protein
MQRSSGAAPMTQNAGSPLLASSLFSSTSSITSSNKSRQRPSIGDQGSGSLPPLPPPPETRQPNVLHKDKDRRPSFGRKASFGTSPSRSKRRPSTSANGIAAVVQVVTDTATPPALPDLALSSLVKPATDSVQSPASIDSFSKMLSRTAPAPANGYAPSSQSTVTTSIAGGQQSESSLVHQHIQETANKRISTLDYLRKA